MTEKKLSMAIPASVVSDTPHLREKTSKIGLIGRAAAIFRIDEILIYLDNSEINQTPEVNLITSLLSYMETPQYLRKKLFELRPELQYAGILPPLRTAHHPLDSTMDKLRVGQYREGVALCRTKRGVLVDIGVQRPAVAIDSQVPVGQRVTTKTVKIGKSLEVELVDRHQVPFYWGFSVDGPQRSLGSLLKKQPFDLVIATSRYGSSFADVAGELCEKWGEADQVLVIFGSPTSGVNEIVQREGLCLGKLVDFIVNSIPLQGTATVRTEEAIFATFAILNVLSPLKRLSA